MFLTKTNATPVDIALLRVQNLIATFETSADTVVEKLKQDRQIGMANLVEQLESNAISLPEARVKANALYTVLGQAQVTLIQAHTHGLIDAKEQTRLSMVLNHILRAANLESPRHYHIDHRLETAAKNGKALREEAEKILLTEVLIPAFERAKEHNTSSAAALSQTIYQKVLASHQPYPDEALPAVLHSIKTDFANPEAWSAAQSPADKDQYQACTPWQDTSGKQDAPGTRLIIQFVPVPRGLETFPLLLTPVNILELLKPERRHEFSSTDILLLETAFEKCLEMPMSAKKLKPLTDAWSVYKEAQTGIERKRIAEFVTASELPASAILSPPVIEEGVPVLARVRKAAPVAAPAVPEPRS